MSSNGFAFDGLWSLPTTEHNVTGDEFMATFAEQFAGSAIYSSPTEEPSALHTIQNFPRHPQERDDNRDEESNFSAPSTSSSSRRDSFLQREETREFLSANNSTLKRKATEDDQEDDPSSSESNHTPSSKANSSTSRARGSRRTPPLSDEARILKRKEQNRAAQRAFRERKEKYVADLEEKVAELENESSSAKTESEALREVISRLRSENSKLRKLTKRVGNDIESTGQQPQSFVRRSHSTSPYPEPEKAPFLAARINAFGPQPPNTTYTTIASNPALMSFTEPMSLDHGASNHPAIDHDFHQPSYEHNIGHSQQTDAWLDIPAQANQMTFDLTDALDDFFGTTSSTITKSHAESPTFPSPIDNVASTRPGPHFALNHLKPVVSAPGFGKLSKREVASMILKGSPFCGNENKIQEHGPLEARLPRTAKSDKNLDLMRAWREVTSDPKFKDANVNELCLEFATMARCDGTNVVIEPSGMQHILEAMNKTLRVQR